VSLEVTLSAGRWVGSVMVSFVLAVLLAACSAGHDASTASSGRLGAKPAGPTIPANTPPSGAHKRCLAPSEQSSEVWFEAADGTRLSGVVLGQGRTGVILAHQRWFNLCSWMPFARKLTEQGYRVLAFDFRGFGASSTPKGRAARGLDLDVAAGVEYLRRQGIDRVVLVGASMGATAALMDAASADATATGVAAVISISGPARFYEMDAGLAVKRMRVPVLFVGSSEEGSYARAARLMYSRAGSRSKRMVLVPGRTHGIGLLEEGANAAQIRELVTTFIEEHTIAASAAGPAAAR
jgi:pimeloyl-ACP methyl ester carboxylesterase